MRKFLMIGIVIAVAAGAAAYTGVFSRGQAGEPGQGQAGPGGGSGARGGSGGRGCQAGRGGQAGRANQGGGGGFGGGGFGGPGGGGGGGGPRVPMTVEVGVVKKGYLAAHLTVVGNLIGEQTVDVAPKTGGRVDHIGVQLGDRVRRPGDRED